MVPDRTLAPAVMARGGRRSRSRAPSSNDDDDAPDAPRTPDPNTTDASLKYRIGSTGKEARARAKLLRHASRRKREARRLANEERSPSMSSESSPDLAGSTTTTAARGTGKQSAVEYRKLRALLERVSLAEDVSHGEYYYVECGDEAEVVDASTFVSRVRMNEARLDEVERAYGSSSGTVWPTKASARRMPAASPEREGDEALDLLPAEVWERLFASVSLKTAVRMASTCKSLWVLSQRKFIVDRRYESMFGRAAASEDERAERTMMTSYLSSERWLEDAHLGETVFPKPVHFGVGPSFVRGLLADETTVTSFDREKVKIWYHGAGIRGDDEAGGRLASLFVEKKSSAARGLTALAINQTSIVAGDDGGRLRIWHSDTLEYVQRRAHAIPNDNAVSALCGIPATSLVVCASRQSSSLEIWETEDVSCVTSLPLGEFLGTEERARHGVTCMSMFGGNSYGRHRSHIGATSRMWAGTTFQKVAGVDLNHANIVDTLSLPESCGPDAEISAIAVNGPLVSTTVKGFGAVIWDRRGMPQEQIVARFDSPFASSVSESEQSSCIDLEDFALWTSNPGDPGVCMFDIRKTFGPPRRQDRWVVGSPETYSPACVLRPRMRTRGFSEEVKVGCFARVPGEPGAVILAPDASCSDARCSIFSKRNDLPTAQEIEELEVADVDDGWRSRRARKQGKPPQPKSRGRFPKRQ